MYTINKITNARIAFLLFTIALFFIDYSRTGCYFLFLLLIDFILHFNQFGRYFDSRFGSILLFVLLYYFFAWIGGLVPLGYSSIIYPVIIIPIIYLYGRWFGEHILEIYLHRVVFYGAFCVALIPLVSVLYNIGQYGFVVDYRNMALMGYNTVTAATGIGEGLVMLSVFIFSFLADFGKKEKWLYTIMAVIAFICGLRIQTRTLVVVCLIVIAICLLFNTMNNKKNNNNGLWNIIIIAALIGVGWWAYNKYSDLLLIMDRFQSEDVSTGNSRTVLSRLIISQIPDYPFGGNPTTVYAHNLWLDATRVAGIIPGFLLIMISISSIKDTIRIVRSRRTMLVTKQLFLSITTAFISAMFVEPIIEGAWQLFLFYWFYIGIGVSVRKLYS